MTNFDIEKHTIYLARHGSHAYGTNIASSDVDVKGIAIPPKEYHLGFLHKFEQYERMGDNEGGNLARLRSLKGTDCDVVIYSFSKFVKLAADCNPNIIEVLFCDEDDILECDYHGEALRNYRHNLLSKKARHTFSGYAHAQLKRIKSHRAWLLNPPKAPPARKDYGLSEEKKMSKGELGAFEAMTEEKRADLSKEAVVLYTQERAYQNRQREWKQYQNWQQNRNEKRSELEAKFGYDTKHGMHLIRLMRMCKEILETGKVNVKRPDAEELLKIRAGELPYDGLIEEAERLDAECGELYETSTVLRHKPNLEAINKFVVHHTERYLSENSES
jgi:predicted nucleotidyltransferase